MLRSWIPLVVALAVSNPTEGRAQASSCRSMAGPAGMPEFRLTEPDDQLLCREGYLLLHSGERKTPYWVLERLRPARFEGPGDRETLGNPFATDPDLLAAGKPAARSKDYEKQKSAIQKRSFDRGHMAPAADMKFSEPATVESFYMSNMAPQQGLNLNRHIWADLEALVRDWACDRGDLIAITGPIYDDGADDTLGEGKVAVPSAFFKIAYEPIQKRAIALVLPNEAVPKKRRKAFAALGDFRVSIQDVEQRTGIRFFPKLDARKRRQVTSIVSPMWEVVGGCNGTTLTR